VPGSAQGIGGARSQNCFAVLLLEFALRANSMLVSGVEFCLRQNSGKSGFCEAKYAPNEVLKNILYLLILFKEKYYSKTGRA
jgi:hypothetical protein